MKNRNHLRSYTSLQDYIEKAVRDYGDSLQGVIISNDTRISILQADGIDVNNQTINGVSVIAEPFLPEDEIQVILS